MLFALLAMWLIGRHLLAPGHVWERWQCKVHTGRCGWPCLQVGSVPLLAVVFAAGTAPCCSAAVTRQGVLNSSGRP